VSQSHVKDEQNFYSMMITVPSLPSSYVWVLKEMFFMSRPQKCIEALCPLAFEALDQQQMEN